ncbi:hypothetical protein PSPO01_15954 [Paraphaeosphaeria sporulosa]
MRVLQLVFALASGISYGMELSHSHVIKTSSFVFAMVAFGCTLLTLIVDGATVRNYRFSWGIEWVLAVFWFALFAVFHAAYLKDGTKEGYSGVDVGRMKRAIWCDLVNALLWMGSGLFSSAICCSGVRASVKERLERRRQRNERKTMMSTMAKVETGMIGA